MPTDCPICDPQPGSQTTLTHREKLIEDAIRFSVAHDIPLKTLASRIAKDSNFFNRVINGGGDCTTAMYERFQAYFEKDIAANLLQSSDLDDVA